jgi:hypothetical protein
MVSFPGIETVDSNNAERDQYSSSKQQCHNLLDIRSSRICEFLKIVVDMGVLVLIFHTRWASPRVDSWAAERLHINVCFSSLSNTASVRFTHKGHPKTQIVQDYWTLSARAVKFSLQENLMQTCGEKTIPRLMLQGASIAVSSFHTVFKFIHPAGGGLISEFCLK